MMRAEQIKACLAAVGIDFIEGESTQRSVYLYPEDVVADDIKPLKSGTVIQVTFTYAKEPKVV